MKRRLFTFALAALTIGLLGSCSKINERIDGLDKRVYDLENNQIASIEQQIATIKESIADLSTIRTNIQTLMDAKTAMGEDITKLKAADQTLEGKINDLKTYVDKELANYATKDWANATFATLATQKEIITDVEKLKTDLAGLDTKLDQAIANLDSSLKGWVNEQLSGYCTTAQLEAKIAELKSEIDALDADNEENKTKIKELKTSLDALSADLADAKATIKIEYEAAIQKAIEANDGYITTTIKNAINEANGKIDALTGRVETLKSDVATLKNDVAALKAMIQTVSIIPAYSNGSLKAEDGILTINCVITPKEAVESLAKENFTILTSESEVLTKSALYGTLTIAKDEDLVLDKTNGTATIKVDVSSVLPAEEDKALTVAVNIKNGISDFTTEFVPVTVPVSVSLDKHSIVIKSPESAKDTTLTATVKNSSKGVIWSNSNNDIAAVDNGKVTIKANASGKDTIVVKTIEGNATDTCFITVLPKGALAGEFSVSATKKVRFSQGNLVATIDATGAPTAWKFAANQYEYIGANVANTKIGKEAGDVDLFGWSTDAASNNWGIHTKTSATNKFTNGNFKDWGKAVGDGNTWRTLTTAEWQYLINKDGNENIRKGKYKYGVTVCEKANCLILAPDDFEGTIAESYDAAAWASAEAAGLVCLPAAGYRYGSNVSSVGDCGSYWSSTAYAENYAYFVSFVSYGVYPGTSDDRSSGFGVRLITESN